MHAEWPQSQGLEHKHTWNASGSGVRGLTSLQELWLWCLKFTYMQSSHRAGVWSQGHTEQLQSWGWSMGVHAQRGIRWRSAVQASHSSVVWGMCRAVGAGSPNPGAAEQHLLLSEGQQSLLPQASSTAMAISYFSEKKLLASSVELALEVLPDGHCWSCTVKVHGCCGAGEILSSRGHCGLRRHPTPCRC